VTERFQDAVRALVRAMIPELFFLGLWEYQVTSARVDESGRAVFDGTPVAAADLLPGAVGWALRPALPGATALPAAGSTVLVGFVNADRARPCVLAYDATAGASPATIPAADIGGETPLALAPALQTWAAAVVTAAAGGGITIPALGEDVAATKARGA
jgi:hypothetical protein